MKFVQETTVYKFCNNGKEAELNRQIAELLKTGVQLNSQFEFEIKTIKRNYNDTLTTKALNAVESGAIRILYAKNASIMLPSYMPFVKYKSGSTTAVAIDVTRYVKVTKGKNGAEDTYSIESNKLYCMIVSAYIYLACIDKDTVLTTQMMKISSFIWARMFNKVLEMRVGLATNRDRYDAFMFFAIKFFLLYVVEAPRGITDNIARSYFPSGKISPIVTRTEMLCEERNINMYQDLPSFCEIIFNNEYTGINPLRVNGSKDVMNYSYFMSQFINLYYLPAALSLECFPYFIWVIVSASNWGYFFNDKLVQDICKEDTPKLMVELIKMSQTT